MAKFVDRGDSGTLSQADRDRFNRPSKDSAIEPRQTKKISRKSHISINVYKKCADAIVKSEEGLKHLQSHMLEDDTFKLIGRKGELCQGRRPRKMTFRRRVNRIKDQALTKFRLLLLISKRNKEEKEKIANTLDAVNKEGKSEEKKTELLTSHTSGRMKHSSGTSWLNYR